MVKWLQPVRHLDLEGAYNLRELGGYPTSDGRTTRWKIFLRADSLHRLSAESQAALVDYGLRAVIDLRASVELAEQPDVFATSSDVAYYHRNFVGDEPLAGAAEIAANAEASERIASQYAGWLDVLKPNIRRVLSTLAEPNRQATIFHCAGGQDRTGVIAALLLGIAGVPAEVVAEDYSLTGRYLTARYFAEEAPPSGVTPENYSWRDYQADFCPADAMLKVQQHLVERYGGIEAYVRAIGLTQGQIDSLRNALVG